MTVKYATTCDIPSCKGRSEEYTSFPVCENCGRYICPEHQVNGSLKGNEDNEAYWCLCISCNEWDHEKTLEAIAWLI